jgi:hypothetical protein
MFTTTHSSNNRLLALEAELLAWKRSPKHQHQQTEPNQDWLSEVEDERETVDEWETETVEAENSRINPETISEPQQEHHEFSREDDLWEPEPEPFSYTALADRLNHSTYQPFRRHTHRVEAQPDELEPLPETTLKSPFSPASPPSPVIPVIHDTPTPLPQFPELDLPIDEPSVPLSFEASLPDAEEDIFSPISSSAFSDEEPSYTSLMQMIQTARHSDTTPATIDVEAQAIAQQEQQEQQDAIAQDDTHSESFSSLLPFDLLHPCDPPSPP